MANIGGDNMKTVKNKKKQEKGCVVKVEGNGSLRRRLFDMGITPGAVITMKKTAPMGDPIEINLRNYNLSIRKAEAEKIVIN